MAEFSRVLGFMNFAAGVALLLFPSAVRPMIEARAEYARLSDNALRLLGVWSLLAGSALMAVTSKQTGEAGVGEVMSRGRRLAV